MQISGVRLALTWPCRLCLHRVLLCTSLCYTLSPFQALGKMTLPPCCQACVFIYSSCGRWVFPLFCAVFLPLPLLQAFPLLITEQCCCSCQPPCLFTTHVGSGSSLLSCGVFLPPQLPHSWLLGVFPRSHQKDFSSPNLWRSVRPTLFPMCLYCSYCLLLSFPFFPGWRSVCPGGYAALAQGCLWKYCGTVKLTLSTSSHVVWEQVTGAYFCYQFPKTKHCHKQCHKVCSL
jgi:hypothetical protein